jgi:hypothetical protein
LFDACVEQLDASAHATNVLDTLCRLALAPEHFGAAHLSQLFQRPAGIHSQLMLLA